MVRLLHGDQTDLTSSSLSFGVAFAPWRVRSKDPHIARWLFGRDNVLLSGYE